MDHGLPCAHDPMQLPDDLPVPVDVGACAHLVGAHMPPMALPATDGTERRVDRPPAGFHTLILYAYPRTGRPGVPPLPGWDEIPGARGCTPESCGFPDHAGELGELGELGAVVLGLSTQASDYQAELSSGWACPSRWSPTSHWL
jgi:peroxiredoxin